MKDGDIVSVDCGVVKNGFFGDSAYTFPVGEVNPKVLNLLKITKESLYKAIEIAIVGNRLGDNAEMAMIELVDYNENLQKSAKVAVEKKTRRSGGAKKKTESTETPEVNHENDSAIDSTDTEETTA